LPTSPRIEAARDAWFAAPDEATRQALCRDMQLQLWQDEPYTPKARWQHTTDYRKRVRGVPRGTPLFHNVQAS